MAQGLLTLPCFDYDVGLQPQPDVHRIMPGLLSRTTFASEYRLAPYRKQLRQPGPLRWGLPRTPSATATSLEPTTPPLRAPACNSRPWGTRGNSPAARPRLSKHSTEHHLEPPHRATTICFLVSHTLTFVSGHVGTNDGCKTHPTWPEEPCWCQHDSNTRAPAFRPTNSGTPAAHDLRKHSDETLRRQPQL